MHLLGRSIIEKFKKKHATSRKALSRWEIAIENCHARNFVELKKTFPAVDLAGNAMIFDVGGNKVRVISVVYFDIQQLLVTHVLRHQEYDKNKW